MIIRFLHLQTIFPPLLAIKISFEIWQDNPFPTFEFILISLVPMVNKTLDK